MSIATDEARKESYRRCLEGCVALAQFAFQDGYVAGRTAKPTAEEINAAAKALCERWNPGEWGTGFETADDDYRRDAEAMLLAARKAVSE